MVALLCVCDLHVVNQVKRSVTNCITKSIGLYFRITSNVSNCYFVTYDRYNWYAFKQLWL